MTAERVDSNYVTIWIWLVVLLIAGLLVTRLPLGKSIVISLVFAIATVKAALVSLNYMHLRSEDWLIRSLAIVPILLVIAMTLVLLPDIVPHQ